MNIRSVLTLVLTCCAAEAVVAAPAPDLTRIPGTPAPPHGKIYADCLAQAAGAATYDETSAKEAHLLRFHCSGVPAHALYDALAPWSAARRSAWTADGRTWRSTSKIVRNLFGTDYCSSDGASDYACDITLNVGGFLDG